MEKIVNLKAGLDSLRRPTLDTSNYRCFLWRVLIFQDNIPFHRSSPVRVLPFSKTPGTWLVSKRRPYACCLTFTRPWVAPSSLAIVWFLCFVWRRSSEKQYFYSTRKVPKHWHTSRRCLRIRYFSFSLFDLSKLTFAITRLFQISEIRFPSIVKPHLNFHPVSLQMIGKGTIC